MVGAQNRMRARKCGIEFQGLLGRGIRLGSGVIGVNAKRKFMKDANGHWSNSAAISQRPCATRRISTSAFFRQYIMTYSPTGKLRAPTPKSWSRARPKWGWHARRKNQSVTESIRRLATSKLPLFCDVVPDIVQVGGGLRRYAVRHQRDAGRSLARRAWPRCFTSSASSRIDCCVMVRHSPRAREALASSRVAKNSARLCSRSSHRDNDSCTACPYRKCYPARMPLKSATLRGRSWIERLATNQLSKNYKPLLWRRLRATPYVSSPFPRTGSPARFGCTRGTYRDQVPWEAADRLTRYVAKIDAVRCTKEFV